jgi:hypothetical protein
LEPFQTEAIDKTFPSAGAVRLLEILRIDTLNRQVLANQRGKV